MLCTAEVERLHVIPTYSHPFEKDLTPFEIRCEMLSAAMRHLGPRLVIDRLEAERPGPSYTVDTVRTFRAKYPDADLIWVGGADTWRARQTWHEWETLEAMIEPFILGRGGVTPPDDVDIPLTLPTISSTAIREAINHGTAIDHLIAPEVLAIIMERGLYR